MAVYALGPYRGLHYRPYFALPAPVSPQDVDAILRAGEAMPPQAATVARAEGSIVDSSFRGARVSWIYPGPATATVFERVAAIAEEVNRQAYRFDLIGFGEPLQYTVYEAPSVGYDWHIDMLDAPTEIQRKLSLTIQLTAGDEYEGGDLELRDGAGITLAPRGLGAVVAFPGWAHHRVTPVTRGTRRSLVAWIGGPPFR